MSVDGKPGGAVKGREEPYFENDLCAGNGKRAVWATFLKELLQKLRNNF